MVTVGLGIYAVGQFLAWILTFYIFQMIYKTHKFGLLGIMLIIANLADFFAGDFSYPIIALTLYLIFNRQKKLNLYLLNSIILTLLIKLIIGIVANTLIIFFYNYHINTGNILGGVLFVGSNFFIKLIISLLFIFCYKYFDLGEKFNIQTSSLFSLLIGYLFVVIYAFMNIVQHYKAYSDLISGILLFILIQCTFIMIVFLKGNQTQKETYTRELTREQLNNLKMYTDQLEHDQIKLRSFEQNYKGTIKKLRSIAQAKDYAKMKTSLGTLEDYSNSYFDNISMQLFKDLNNVVNPYLKSLLISKLTLINQNKIDCHFECRDVVNEIAINIFDLVRLLGISIDNAIEATKGQKNGQIQIALVQETTQLSIIINNTTSEKTDINEMMQEGFTTKQHHTGLGMVNVQDIKRKYPNLFVQYRKNDKWFNLNIVIIK